MPDAMHFTLPPDDPESWQVRIDLPAWEAMGQALEQKRPAGVILAFEAKGEDPPAPTDEEMARAKWFADHHQEIIEAALQGLLGAYADLVERYRYDDEERSRWMPDVGTIDDLRPLVRATYITMHDATRGGLPYIGILFDCTWDPEHGTGALLNGLRLVAAGEAEHAYDGSLAAEDAQS